MTIDYIHAIGPAGVITLGGVSKFVQHGGNLDSQLADASAGDEYSFFLIPGTGKHNFVFDIALHLPDVAGMRLGDVDHQKRDPVFVLIVELIESGNLPPERRSGITSEDKNYRLLAGELPELNCCALIELH